MDIVFATLKKIVVTMVFTVFLVCTLYIPQDFTPRAEAGPVGGSTEITQILNNLELLAINSLQSITAFSTDSLFVKETILDGIAWAIAKQLINTMVSDLVQWVNSGSGGGAQFIQDLRSFLINIAADELDQFSDILNDFLCEPFRVQVRVVVEQELSKSYIDKLPNLFSCDLSLFGGTENYEAFINGDFDAGGGWAGWFAIISEPNTYTQYGATEVAVGSGRASILEAQQNEVKVADFGSGFLSTKVCDQIQGGTGRQICNIVTPGKAIQEALSNNLDTGRETLVAADEIDEIIASLLGQLANKAITGTGGLLALSGGSSGGGTGGSYLGDLSTGSDSNDSVTSAFSRMQSQIAAQQNYLNLTVQYRALLVTFNENTDNSLESRAAASAAIADIDTAQNNIARTSADAAGLVAEYQALENELRSASIGRSSEIRNRQAQIVNEFNQLDLYTQSDADIAVARWNTILGLRINTINPDVIIDPASIGDVRP